jgi:hypothetical protein
MVKHGMLTDKSLGDFGTTKKAAWVERHGPAVAAEGDQGKLRDPVPLREVLPPAPPVRPAATDSSR